MEYSSDDSEKITWGFRLGDKSGSWGWQTVAGRHWWSEILPKLQAFESMTWAELFRAAGGRSKGNNHHTVEVANLTAQAKKRLMAIQRDENVHRMFSLRLTGTTRIYGIRQGRVLQLLWYDTHHGDNARAVYPVRAR